jgi:hypothetical protein
VTQSKIWVSGAAGDVHATGAAFDEGAHVLAPRQRLSIVKKLQGGDARGLLMEDSLWRA